MNSMFQQGQAIPAPAAGIRATIGGVFFDVRVKDRNGNPVPPTRFSSVELEFTTKLAGPNGQDLPVQCRGSVIVNGTLLPGDKLFAGHDVMVQTIGADGKPTGLPKVTPVADKPYRRAAACHQNYVAVLQNPIIRAQGRISGGSRVRELVTLECSGITVTGEREASLAAAQVDEAKAEAFGLAPLAAAPAPQQAAAPAQHAI